MKKLLFVFLFTTFVYPFVFSEDALVIMPDGKVGVGREAVSSRFEVNGRIEDKSGIIMPVGTILPFAGSISKIPSGWLLCDGSAYSSTYDNGKYGDLFFVIETNWGNGTSGTDSTTGDFNVPDLRGQFLRGVDNNTGNDPDAAARSESAAGGNTGDAVGSKQIDQYKSHAHGIGHIHPNERSGGSYCSSDSVTLGYRYTSASGGTETRPKNVYVNYIIKY